MNVASVLESRSNVEMFRLPNQDSPCLHLNENDTEKTGSGQHSWQDPYTHLYAILSFPQMFTGEYFDLFRHPEKHPIHQNRCDTAKGFDTAHLYQLQSLCCLNLGKLFCTLPLFFELYLRPTKGWILPHTFGITRANVKPWFYLSMEGLRQHVFFPKATCFASNRMRETYPALSYTRKSNSGITISINCITWGMMGMAETFSVRRNWQFYADAIKMMKPKIHPQIISYMK